MSDAATQGSEEPIEIGGRIVVPGVGIQPEWFNRPPRHAACGDAAIRSLEDPANVVLVMKDGRAVKDSRAVQGVGDASYGAIELAGASEELSQVETPQPALQTTVG